MEYRMLGTSGVKVSPLCLGSMNFGGPTPEAESVRIILLYLTPFMPETVEVGLSQLGWTRPDEPLSVLGQWGALPPGAKVTKAQPLFPRNV